MKARRGPSVHSVHVRPTTWVVLYVVFVMKPKPLIARVIYFSLNRSTCKFNVFVLVFYNLFVSCIMQRFECVFSKQLRDHRIYKTYFYL